ncbi:MAG: 5-(carboxyamino)imidazole ribonucleotide synthase [Pseudomonadota bacterium]
MSALPPGSVIGMLGGGQLGRLMALEAARLGYDVHTFCPEPRSPAARVSSAETVADYTNDAALKAFAGACDVVSYEFENVPAAAVAAIESVGVPVRPGVAALENSQDRKVEKEFLNSIEVPTVAFESVHSPENIQPAVEKLGGAGILKRRRMGYDGKGQARVEAGDDMAAAWTALGSAPCILEAMAPFKLEISAIVARGLSGEIAAFEPSENGHANGILRASHVPASIRDETRTRAIASATRLAEALDYVGVIALEFFVLDDETLIANEFAPRVHNSGHWTPEACATGQFEQHIRAVAGLPLGDPTRLFDAQMDNLLGDEAETAFGGPGVTHYGKREAKAGRKMGHVTRRLGPAT